MCKCTRIYCLPLETQTSWELIDTNSGDIGSSKCRRRIFSRVIIISLKFETQANNLGFDKKIRHTTSQEKDRCRWEKESNFRSFFRESISLLLLFPFYSCASHTRTQRDDDALFASPRPSVALVFCSFFPLSPLPHHSPFPTLEEHRSDPTPFPKPVISRILFASAFIYLCLWHIKREWIRTFFSKKIGALGHFPRRQTRLTSRFFWPTYSEVRSFPGSNCRQKGT